MDLIESYGLDVSLIDTSSCASQQRNASTKPLSGQRLDVAFASVQHTKQLHNLDRRSRVPDALDSSSIRRCLLVVPISFGKQLVLIFDKMSSGIHSCLTLGSMRICKFVQSMYTCHQKTVFRLFCAMLAAPSLLMMIAVVKDCR